MSFDSYLLKNENKVDPAKWCIQMINAQFNLAMQLTGHFLSVLAFNSIRRCIRDLLYRPVQSHGWKSPWKFRALTTYCHVGHWPMDTASVSWWTGCRRCRTKGSPGQTCVPPRAQPQAPGTSDWTISPAWPGRSDPGAHQPNHFKSTSGDIQSQSLIYPLEGSLQTGLKRQRDALMAFGSSHLYTIRPAFGVVCKVWKCLLRWAMHADTKKQLNVIRYFLFNNLCAKLVDPAILNNTTMSTL